MTKIEIEDLHQYLIDHKDEVDFVVLQWTFNPNYAVIETRNVGTVGKKPNWPLYAVFSFNRIDAEQCFIGFVEDAIEYASNYGQWDSCDFDLEDGILTAEYDSYHPDALEWPTDADTLAEDPSITDIEYIGLFYYNNNRIHAYNGPVYRRKNDEDDD